MAKYVNETILRQTPLQMELREVTHKLPEGHMQISPDQGTLLSLLVQISGTKKALEIGTFTGYSGLCIAAAMPPDGKLICCDVSEKYTSIAREYWQKAGLASKITLHLAPALETTAKLLKDGAAESFDLVFIDADKDPYPQYYEAALKLLKPGGLVIMDNVVAGGEQAARPGYDLTTHPMHALNTKIINDNRVDAMIVTSGAGFMVARKR